jgi:hypothetical protein
MRTKLGDVCCARLLRLNFAASFSRTFGTVFIERGCFPETRR